MEKTIARWAFALLAVATLTAPATLAQRGICGYTAQEARRACNNDAWDDFHLNRGKCVNDVDRDDRIACRSANSREVREALEECQAQYEARLDVCEAVGNGPYDPPFAPEDFVDLDAKGSVENPYVSLEPGHTSVVRAGDDELIVIYVTDEVKVIEDVPCRVVVDAALEVGGADDADGEDDDAKRGGIAKGAAVEYEAAEVTDDWYALHVNGDVWYCGELSRNFEDGELADLDGSFEAGEDGAKPGILIRANPIVGETYRQEFALGEAEDLAEVLSLAAEPADAKGDDDDDGFPCDGKCLETRDFTPLEPDVDERKYYLDGVGFVLAIGFEDGEETDREALVCSGDSLAVLADPACAIEDLDQLLEKLCEVHPAFCADDGD